METLINNTKLVDGALVAAIKKMRPDDQLEEVLDMARYIILKRILNKISKLKLHTAFHIIEELYIHDLPLDDIASVLHWVADDDRFDERLRDEVADVLETKSFIIFHRYIQVVLDSTEGNTQSCCLPVKRRLFCSNNKSKRDQSSS